MRSTLAVILVGCLAVSAVPTAASEYTAGPIVASIQRQGEQLAGLVKDEASRKALSPAGQAPNDGWADVRRHIGSAVLVRELGGGEAFGRLVDVTDDTLTVSVGGDTRSVLKTSTCDISLLRRDRSAAVGWMVGLTLGGLATGIVLSKTIGVKPAPFALAGTGLGALIGMNGTERRPIYRSVVGGCRG